MKQLLKRPQRRTPAPISDQPGTGPIVAKHIVTDGISQTAISFLSLIRYSRPTQLAQGMLNPSLCLIVQGAKRMRLDNEVLNYGVGSFVVASVDMPVAGQVVEASPSKPYLGVSIGLDPKEIAALIVEAKIPVAPDKTTMRGAYIGKASSDLHDAITRLLHLLEKPREIPFLAPLIKREIVYRLLTSPDGYKICNSVIPGRQELGVAMAIDWLKKNYRSPVSVAQLAKEAGQSLSGFHRKFKAVTTLSPLQYQKRLKLLEARRLLLTTAADAATVSFTVGYESPSQFSREYRRLFGAPPLKDIENLRKTAALNSRQN